MYPGFTVTIKSNFIVRIYIQILLLSIETEKNIFKKEFFNAKKNAVIEMITALMKFSLNYSTVTDFARFFGLSGSIPLRIEQ